MVIYVLAFRSMAEILLFLQIEAAEMNCNIYALYRGDEYIMDGTLQEIADARGIKRDSLIWMQSPTYHKRKHRQELVLLEEHRRQK